jgi:hypothetical protein
MTKWLLAAALLFMAFPSSGMAQSEESLVGTWRLVSMTNLTDKGEVDNASVRHFTGFLTYTADGRMMVIITAEGRKPLSNFPPSIEESAEAFSTLSGAYAGSYTVADDKVIHHIEVAWVQNVVNTDQVRFVKLQGDRLTLRGGWSVDGGVPVANSELVWERMKPKTTDK